MYGRYASREPPLYMRLFAADAEPSIVLAHSRRDLVLRGIGLEGRAEEGDYDHETETASAACARWLGDDRRDRKSTRLNSSHIPFSPMPSSA